MHEHFILGGSEDKDKEPEHELTNYETAIMLGLVDLNETLQQLSVVINAGKFRPLHLKSLQIKTEGMFAQFEVMLEMYG